MAGLCCVTLQSAAQELTSNTEVSPQVIETRIKEIQAATDLDEETRTGLIENYRKALGFIETARDSSAKADAFARARESASEEAQAIREKLAQAADSGDVMLDLADDASAREIEQSLQKERANQVAVSANFAGLEQQLAAEANRPRIVRQRLLDASRLTERLAGELKLPPPPDQSTLLTEARRWVLSTQAAAANAEIRMLDQELISQSMRIELLQAQRDRAARSLGRIEARVVLLEKLLAGQRRSETAQVIADSDLASFGAVANHPLLRELAQRNLELSRQLQQLTSDLEQVEAATRNAVNKFKDIQQSYQTARQRLEIAGLSQALGQVLHEQRRDLPDLRQSRRHARQRTQIIAETGLRGIQLEAERRELQDEPGYIAGRLAEATAEERDELAGPVQQLVTSGQALLSNTIAANTEYLRALAELDFQQTQLQTIGTEFDSYLVERLLWVRNKKVVGIDTVRVLPGEVIDFLDPRPWLEAVGALTIQATEAPWLGLALLISGLLLWKTKALRVALRATTKSVGKLSEDNFVVTARALGITGLLTLPWPLLTLAAGWELSQSLDVSDGAKAIGAGLLRITRALFFLRAFRVLCLDGGLAEVHFKWSASVCRALRVQLDQLLLTFVLPAFVLVVEITGDPVDFGGELARISFVIATAGLAVFLARLLQPKTGILASIRRAQGYTKEISWLWLVLGTAIPVLYVIAALAGYLYSAITLMTLIMSSLWLVFGLVVTHELAARWLLVVGGRLQLKAARERRDAARAKEQEGSASGEDLLVPVEEPTLDVFSIDADTRKLLNLALLIVGFVGLGGIWSSVLPALGFLREITLWEFLDGAPGQQTLMPVTLADLLLVLVYVFVTIIAARTVPSLLEAILRQRGSVTPGTRLAFATLARYSIVLVGVSLVAGTIGFNWGKIQWLVAALGVGIGFGLQEIIANFISGLIILVERPIRIGDLVTVGDTSGTVTRLQIRATTVTNFNRQELLVPNKEFITGRVLNWSLSDEVIRLVVKVGVAYGSDMKKALALVREAVEENEVVLKDPQPLITFDEFGDNSLNITARCFIASLKKRREAISDLNLAVNQKFNDAGIVIAFPQRDVHLDTTSPLDVRIRREPAE
jgi:potassium efflux system protein